MHELSVTESVLEIAQKHARTSNATRVTIVNLVIGQLSSIVDESVQFYWDIITEGTLCAGSRLSFQRKPAVFHCLNCGADFGLNGEKAGCPVCESLLSEILSGEEFYVDSIEIEKGQEDEHD